MSVAGEFGVSWLSFPWPKALSPVVDWASRPRSGGAWGAGMHFRIRWARVLAIASGLTLFVAGAMPAAASAHAARKATCWSSDQGCANRVANLRRPPISGSRPMGSHVSQAKGRTLIFGSGDTADVGPPLNINPGEPISNLASILTGAGYGVDVDQSSSLPTHLTQYQSIWYISTNPLTTAEETQLETFVQAGGGVYLTGESPCCEPLNSADGSVVDALVTGGAVQVGGQGFADSGTVPESVNSSAIDDVATIPNTLTTWLPSQPGGIAEVDSSNVLTSTTFGGQLTATGAVWDGSSLTAGTGRLAVLMDINWLESETWDPTTSTQMAVNVERFLMSSLPVPAVTNSQWAGYAAKAHGVQDVHGEWTVPTVDCSQAPKASAARIWVGIDGYGNADLANAGIGVTCSGPTASPSYYLFTGVHRSSETPITGCGTVAPGDDVFVDITNHPFGSSTFVATIKVNGTELCGAPFTLSEPSKRDRSAECVVELPAGFVGSGIPADYQQLAHFTPVQFSECVATATQNAGDLLDTEQLATGTDGAFVVRALNMGRNPLAQPTQPDFPGIAWSVNWSRF